MQNWNKVLQFQLWRRTVQITIFTRKKRRKLKEILRGLYFGGFFFVKPLIKEILWGIIYKILQCDILEKFLIY